MSNRLKALLVIFALLAVAVVPAVAQQPNIVDAAVANPNFETLVAAAQAAGLVDTLSSPGPFTVFAPTDGAFATLLSDLGVTADQLLADTDLLTTVLLYHVVPGEFFAEDILAQDFPFVVETASGESFVVDPDPNSDRLRINGGQATVSIVDLDVSNGVIHVLDNVLLPPSVTGADTTAAAAPAPAPAQPNIVEIAVGNGDFSTLVAAVQAAGLADTLATGGPYTVFAPTNAAFNDALNALGITADDLLADTDLLTDILLYHVVPSEVFAADIVNAGSVTAGTLNGASITVRSTTGGVQVIDSSGALINVVIADLDASNGVVHAVDQVLLPPSLTS